MQSTVRIAGKRFDGVETQEEEEKVKIAIYRSRKSGEILRVGEVPKEQDWTEAAADYNSGEYIDTVEIIKELTDLELYLYNRSEKNISSYKEEIEGMQLTLYEIEKLIEWLCGKVKGID